MKTMARVDVSPHDGRRRACVFVAIALLCFVGFTKMSAQTKNEEKAVTVRGTLERVAGIGGETTGWAIRLNSDLEVGGKRLRSIEVSGDGMGLAKLENRHVEAVGRLTTRHGIERGDWPVLEVTSIKEEDSDH